MANPEHVKIAKLGSHAIMEWQTRNDAEMDLTGADLSRTDLGGSNFNLADFYGANLTDAVLTNAVFSNTNLVNANLSRADLDGADLSNAILQCADLSNANLSDADFSNADLSDANLKYAKLLHTIFHRSELNHTEFIDTSCVDCVFSALDLSAVRDLDRITHEGPSAIGVDTILQSKNKIPDAFLRGCGYDPRIQPILLGDRQALEDAAYAAAEGLSGLTLQSCFISYSSKNQAFADRLQQALNDAGVDYWYAPKNAVWGRKLRDQITTEIRRRDRLVLVCSKESLDDADWVRYELEEAVAEEKRRERGETEGVVPLLYPLMIDDTLLEWDNHLRPRLLDVLAGDFRGATQGKAFDKRLPKLIEGLKATGTIR